MIQLNGHNYKILLLDTNALTEVVQNDLRKKALLVKYISEMNFIPAFSIYNAYELYPKEDIFQKFIDLFSIIPSFMIFPYKCIIEEEIKAFEESRPFNFDGDIAFAFSLMNGTDSNLKKFMEKYFTEYDIKKDIEDIYNIADHWEKRRIESINALREYQNIDTMKLFKELEEETVIKDIENHGFTLNKKFDLRRFPGMRVMEYSFHKRLYTTSKRITPNDVMDVKISCILPYVDGVITESYQAELYKQLKYRLKQMNDKEIFRIKDL